MKTKTVTQQEVYRPLST